MGGEEDPARGRDFSKGGGGHTVSNNSVMAFSPRNIVGCLLKKGLERGGRSRALQDPPSYALARIACNIVDFSMNYIISIVINVFVVFVAVV